MKINTWLDPEDYPSQEGMSKSEAANYFKELLSASGIEWSELKDKDIWYSREMKRFMLMAEYNG